jgi:hypothetical protein
LTSQYFASICVELPSQLIVSHRIAIVVHPCILRRTKTSNCHRSSSFHIASPSFHIALPSLFIPVFCVKLQRRIAIVAHRFTSQLIVSHRTAIVGHPCISRRNTTSNCHRSSSFHIAAHRFTSHRHRCSSLYFASNYNVELPSQLIVSHRSSSFHIALPSLFIPVFCVELQHRIAIAAHPFTSHCHRCSSLYFASSYTIELPFQLIVL